MTIRRPFSAVVATAALTFAITAPAAVRAGQPHAAAWWNKAWKYRKIVRVNFPRRGNDLSIDFFKPSTLLGRRFLTGKAVITLESKNSPSTEGIVVTDSEGKVLPCRAYAGALRHRATVMFRAEPKTADYYIYYANPKAKPAGHNWRRDAFPLMMVTVAVASPEDIETPARAARAVLQAEQQVGKTKTHTVQFSGNPFRLKAGAHYITLYSGLLYAPEAGTYQFALDVGGTAHLLIDGSLLLTVRGGPRPAGAWGKKVSAALDRGLHTCTILHGETTTTQGIRVAWRQPGDRQFSLVTGDAFARGSYAPAEVIGFGKLSKAVNPFFTFERSDAAFKVGGGKAMAALKLQNLTPGDRWRCKWNVGNQSFTGCSPMCFLEADKKYKVLLEVSKDGESFGTYERTVNLAVLPHVGVEAALELVRCPNVVYDTEEARLTFKISNSSECAVPVRFERAAPKDKAASKDIEVPPGGERSLDIDLVSPPPEDSSGLVRYRLWLAGSLLEEETVHLVRPGPHLARLKPKLGHLVDHKGRRVIIATRLEDENEYRRWAVLKWLARLFAKSPKKILIFGDPMVNISGRDGSGGYVKRLKTQLGAAGVTVTFVQSNQDAVIPCIADIPTFASALAEHSPDLVVVSPGSRDALKGVARRQLARALDVFIDLARSQEHPAEVVLVSPPPLVSNPRRSAALATAVETVARQHHVRFVGLHSLITSQDNWKNLYKQGANDEVYYLYPNPSTHEKLAEAILDAVE